MFRFVPPPPDLRAWVLGGVILRSDPQLACTRFPALAGAMLVVRLAGTVHQGQAGGPALPAAAWLTANTGPSVYWHDGPVHAVGLILQPPTAHCWLGTPLHALEGSALEAAAVLPPAWRAVEQAVRDAPDDITRLSCLFGAVRAALGHTSQDASGRRLQQMARLLHGDLAAAGDALGWSARQLERRCLAQFGMAPKQFQRIVRMQATLHAAARGPHPRAALAADQGYYDQSHLARDLRHLAGASLPTLLPQLQAGQGEYWPLAVGAQAQAPTLQSAWP